MKRLAAFLSDRRGGAALEMVLVMPAMLAIMAGVYDGARFVIQAQQVKIAADAGADWARVNGWSQTGIVAAMNTATSTVLSAASAQLHIRCNAAGPDVGAGSACPGGELAGDFVVMTAQSQFTPAAPWGAFVPTTINGQSVVRIS